MVYWSETKGLATRRIARALFAAMISLLFLCLFMGNVFAEEPVAVNFERPKSNEIPEQVAEWAESMKETQGLHRLDHDGKTWVMVAWGSKATGGYDVTVDEAEQMRTGVIVLSVSLTAPGEEDIVTQAFTYPYDLIVIDQTDAPLAAEFGEHPTLWLPEDQKGLPLVSERVFLQTPMAGSELGQTLRVKGAAKLFEGTFHIVLEDGHNQLVNQLGTASAGGPEWGVIDVELEYPIPSNPHGHLIIMWQDAKDGSWVEEIGVPVTFETYKPIGSDDGSEEPSFHDIGGHWAEAAIERAVENGVVNGYPDGTFRPESQVTRAEFLKMVLAAFEIEPIASGEQVPFDDTAGHWASGYVNAAIREGIVKADDYGNEFSPDRAITRYEMAVQLVRVLNQEDDTALHANKAAVFKDAEPLDAAAKGYIGTVFELGIFEGYPDGTIGIERATTRAEAVVVIQRALAARDA